MCRLRRDGNWTQSRWVPIMGRVKPRFHEFGFESG